MTQEYKKGFVKQVLSGDTLILRDAPRNGPPPEWTISIARIQVPKLGRRPGQDNSSTNDEPYAWEAREFLRKRLIGKEVSYQVEYNLIVGGKPRDFCWVFLGENGETYNIGELLVKEGLAEVRRGNVASDREQALHAAEEEAKTSAKGRWSEDTTDNHIRKITWTAESPAALVESLKRKPVKAVIEHVRDGSTVRAFLLPSFNHVTIQLSGVRCPQARNDAPRDENAQPTAGEPFGDEAKFYTESRLLQRDVEVILESSSNNNNYMGSVLHPNGNIAEFLLREGMAKCVDWSMSCVTGGPDKLRAAERQAKEKRLRLWKDYVPNTVSLNLPPEGKEYTAKVVEIVNADAIMVKTESGQPRKIFLSSIRPPRLQEGAAPEPQGNKKQGTKPEKQFRPLFDIPYMYDAREFLRKTLIGKKARIIVDYIQPKSDQFPEKTCCTVEINQNNVAEQLVAKGLATVVRYRQDNDQRSMQYDKLLAAEMRATKAQVGVHGKKSDASIPRIIDVTADANRAKQYMTFLKRGRCEAMVEYVASGSRLRVHVPKESCLITFLLCGIQCPRASLVNRPASGGQSSEGDPFGDEALAFTKELCLQREVELEVDSMDKAGNFIGWLFVDGVNLSVRLVELGLSTMHPFSVERSQYSRELQAAEDKAKAKKEKLWENYVEVQKTDEVDDDVKERNVNYKSVVVTEVGDNLHFFAQHNDEGTRLEELMSKLREEFNTHPPLAGAYTPKRGDMCASKFSDGQWYRAKIERTGGQISVYYVDYGNREQTVAAKLASLPAFVSAEKPFAHEYALAFVQLPEDNDCKEDARKAFAEDTQKSGLRLNVEYSANGVSYVTLEDSEKEDIGKALVKDGLLTFEHRKELRLQKLMREYETAQDSAKKSRLNIWQYGDFRADDSKEFGYQQR